MHIAQLVGLLMRFHPFGHHVHTDAVRHRNHGLNDRGIVAAFALKKCPVQLDRVRRHERQVTERRISRAEVVERDLYTLRVTGAVLS
jgi:hypothetical protein